MHKYVYELKSKHRTATYSTIANDEVEAALSLARNISGFDVFGAPIDTITLIKTVEIQHLKDLEAEETGGGE